MELTKDQESYSLTLLKKGLVVDFYCVGVLATLSDSAYVLAEGAKRTFSERSYKGHVNISRLLGRGR